MQCDPTNHWWAGMITGVLIGYIVRPLVSTIEDRYYKTIETQNEIILELVHKTNIDRFYDEDCDCEEEIYDCEEEIYDCEEEIYDCEEEIYDCEEEIYDCEEESEEGSTRKQERDQQESEFVFLEEDEEKAFEDMVEDFTSREIKTEKDILQRGLNSLKEPSKILVKAGGGYASADYMKNYRDEYQKFIENYLTIEEESAIINVFEFIVGMKYHEAIPLVKEKGYTLFPTHVSARTHYKDLYDGSVLGVKIEDSCFDRYSKTPGENAIIREIMNVGGVQRKEI